MPKTFLKCVATVAAAVAFTSCSASRQTRVPRVTPEREAALDEAFATLLEKYGVLTAGVGVIRGSELQWAGYYGFQSPERPASAQTQFNVASVTKTVTAEAILRLAAEERIDLDEPMAVHWLDPDLVGEPRASRVTPRMALTHSTGFPNWRFLDDVDGAFDIELPLRFLFEPGSSYSYSGEGFEYVARFAEEKLGTGFEELVEHYVFAPSRMEDAFLSRRSSNFPNIVQPQDAQGNFPGHYCTPWGECLTEGEWSAAGGFRVTVADFAAFLSSVMNREGYPPEIADQRDSVLVEQWNRPASLLVRCELTPTESCPNAQGYGLGWQVADYGDYEILAHRGSDWGEAALVYFYTDSKDGVIIFLNAPNERALAMMPEAIELLHPGSPIKSHYQGGRAP